MLTSSAAELGFLSMLVVPFLVFIARIIARIIDVSIGTLRSLADNKPFRPLDRD